MDRNELRPDEQFEKFLTERTAELPTERKAFVIRLARMSFYGVTLSEHLFPGEPAQKAEISHGLPTGPTGPSGQARVRYHTDTFEAAEQVVEDFNEKYPGRSKLQKRSLFLHRTRSKS